jgi:hypothetical protein
MEPTGERPDNLLLDRDVLHGGVAAMGPTDRRPDEAPSRVAGMIRQLPQ